MKYACAITISCMSKQKHCTKGISSMSGVFSWFSIQVTAASRLALPVKERSLVQYSRVNITD